MPEEYVYKVGVDDAEIKRKLAEIDAAFEQVAVKASRAFQNVGQGSGAGLQTIVNQTKAAAQEMEKANKQQAASEKNAVSEMDKRAKELIKIREQEIKVAKQAAKVQSDIDKEQRKQDKQRIADLNRSFRENQKRINQGIADDKRAAREKSKTAAATRKSQRDAARQFIRTTKVFGKQRNELNGLVKQHGSFNVTIGKTRDEMNDLEKEVDDVIRADQRLGKEIDNLIAKNKKFQVSLRPETFAGGPQQGVPSQTFRQAGFAAQRVGLPGAAALGEAAAVGGAAGIVIAGALLATKELITAFARLGKAGFDAFKRITESAVEAAKEIEVARAQFTAFFQGDTVAAEAALSRLLKLSKDLGQNVVGIGRAFLPEVESLDQLERVTEIAVALSRFQPEQGITGARIALQEALAGEFRSLGRRFEIPPDAIDRIRDAFNTTGITGFLEELQAELERTGRSVDDLSDTFSVSVGRIRERFRQLSATLGEPIVDELKDQFNAIDDELQELEPDLVVIADALGQVVAKLSEIVGIEIQEFLASFDPEPLRDLVVQLFAVVDAVGVVFEVFDPGAGLASGVNSTVGIIGNALLRLETRILEFAKTLNETRTSMNSFFISAAKSATLISASRLDLTLIVDDEGARVEWDATTQALGDLVESLEEFEEAPPVDFDLLLDEHLQEIEDFNKGLDELFEKLESGEDAGEDAANNFLLLGQSIEALGVIQKDFAEAQEKVNDAVDEFNIEANLKFQKLLTDATRARLDFEIDAAEKRIDIETKDARKRESIRRRNSQAIVAAGVDLSDKEADIIRKHGDAVLDLEDDLGKKRLKAEEDFRDELERIRDRFNFDANEAALANDAKALRRIRRRQAFEEDQAKKNRDKTVRDIDKEGEDRKAAIDRQLEREIRDAGIANARKLRDLATSLDQQLETQRIARQQDIDDQALAEKRKREELNQSLNEQLQDYQTWWDERNRTTSEGIAEDLEAMQGYSEEAVRLLDQIQGLGITFDPITGEAIGATPPVSVTDTEDIENIRDRVIELMGVEAVTTGAMPGGTVQSMIRQGTFAPEIADLDVATLIERLAQLQASLGITDQHGGFVDTSGGLDLELLLGAALQAGEPFGVTEGAILEAAAVDPVALEDFEEWVAGFIQKFALESLPDLNARDFVGIVPADALPPGFAPDPSTMSMVLPQGATPFNIEGEPQIVPGQQGFGESMIPGAIPMQFPVSPLMQMQQQGTLLSPIDPAFMFNTEAFQDNLQGQIDSQLATELQKRGSIEDTADFAELIMNQQASKSEAILDEQLADFRAAKEAEIAVLEDALAAQLTVLEQVSADPALAGNVAASVEAVNVLTDALDTANQELADANEEAAQEQVMVVEAGLDDQVDATEDAVDDKVGILRTGLNQEVNATQASSDKQVGIVQDRLGQQMMASTDFRLGEIEAEETHADEKIAVVGEGLDEQIDLSSDFWMAWQREVDTGTHNDLLALQNWINQRNAILSQQIPVPGMGGVPPGTVPSVGGGDTSTDDTTSPGSTTATLPQLQALARSLGIDLGLGMAEINAIIAELAYAELVALIADWQEQVSPRALGGGFGPGQTLMVGEQGMEIIRTGGAVGTVDPVSSLLFRTPPSVDVGGGTNIDRSTNLGGFSFPDPRGIPPIYVRMMENVAAEVVRKAWKDGM